MATMDLSNPRTARRCRAVIQQCSLALTRACKKSARSTAKALATTLTEAVARACKETAPEELRDQVMAKLRAVQAVHDTELASKGASSA